MSTDLVRFGGLGPLYIRRENNKENVMNGTTNKPQPQKKDEADLAVEALITEALGDFEAAPRESLLPQPLNQAPTLYHDKP